MSRFTLGDIAWPPRNLSSASELSGEKAEELIAEGTLFFEGFVFQANHTLIRQPRFYATVSIAAAGQEPEASSQPRCTIADTSLVLSSQPLEQPSLALCFGTLPGTITLHRYVNAITGPRRSEPISEYEIQPRATDGLLVIQRLHFLMKHGWNEDIDIAEDFLFTQLIYDPQWNPGAPPQLAKQIAVLIAALSHPSWIDFGDPPSQVLANHYDTMDLDPESPFWQQLLLSVELDLRLRAAGDQEQSMLSCVPEKVAWDIALSKVWLPKMAFIPLNKGFLRPATKFNVRALTKDTQKERLLSFARNMKWVDMHNVERMLEEDSDGDTPLEFRNAYTSSWITGAILPGESACWLAMRCLIDCDSDIINAPHGFHKMAPSFGFQYSGSTYWFFQNIVAKVLGASRGVNQDYGWVGPCIPSTDLCALQTVFVHTEAAHVRLSKSRIQRMASRSAPLGPPTHSYPLREYEMPLPDPDPSHVVNSVRIQKLAFKRRSLPPVSANDNHDEEQEEEEDNDLPATLDAAVVFAVEKYIIPVRLRYNVSFIHAPPCRKGPHPLFWDYAYRTIRVDELLLDLRSWNGVFVDAPMPNEQQAKSASGSGSASSAESGSGKDHNVKGEGEEMKTEQEKNNEQEGETKSNEKKKKKKKSKGPDCVLVVEAYGVRDNEVLARAWAAHIGFSAVVARKGQTCMACAVRMAYAAAVDMVILGEGN